MIGTSPALSGRTFRSSGLRQRRMRRRRPPWVDGHGLVPGKEVRSDVRGPGVFGCQGSVAGSGPFAVLAYDHRVEHEIVRSVSARRSGGGSFRGGAGHDRAGGSVGDGDGAVGFAGGFEVGEVEMAVVGVAEEGEDFDVGEAVVVEPVVEVVDIAHAGGCFAVTELAVSVADHDGEALRHCWVASGPAELEDLALRIFEVQVQRSADIVEQ